ncbi:MAG: SH3 domain-containing protein [Bauldia sp.]
MAVAIILAAALGGSVAVQAQQVGQTTGLPIPRFVSLAAGEVNVRNGPGSDFPISWVFVKARYPVEVINEYDNWRRIRDINGQMGWVLGTLLSAERTAVVRGEAGTTANLYAQPSTTAQVVYLLQAGVQAAIDECDNGWCRLADPRFNGWIEQALLWGTYPNERVE